MKALLRSLFVGTLIVAMLCHRLREGRCRTISKTQATESPSSQAAESPNTQAAESPSSRAADCGRPSASCGRPSPGFRGAACGL